MNPKTTIYLFYLGGIIFLCAIWAWALSGGFELPELVIATVVTAIICNFNSTTAATKIKNAPGLSIADIAAGPIVIALVLSLFGFFVLIWQCIPNRNGPDTHLDRRYSLLFFALMAYSFLFSFLTNRKIKR
ncbi:MAG TPA: hypothetical protein VNW30_10930 [Opitutaceae bacterium]|jgi:hypothetical protein|nr:hypothetical protein [Opitutaceae bacterium]